jgi:diacylglycerol O-acyltransferase / wax synthase
MQRLTGMDATFLYLESRANQMHVASVAIFDPTSVPGGYSFEKVRDMVDGRLHNLPPFRRRVVDVPLGLHHPIWIEDPDFDLDFHVRRAALPSPGSATELAAFASDVIGRPLDRDRPLWEMWVLEGLEHGHVATITKVHHAAIDGVSGAELMVNLLDLEPDPAPIAPPEQEWRPDRHPSDLEMLAYAGASIVRQPLRMVRLARRTVDLVLATRRRNRDRGTVAAPPGFFDAPPTSFNGAITPHRKVAFVDTSLDDIKMVKNAFGVTVNDVVLAVCSGALRHYLEAQAELPERGLVAMCPISVRSEEEKGTLGNRVSGMTVGLASDIDDPVERLYAIHESTKGAKDQHHAIGAADLTDWTEFAAPAVAARAARLYSRMRLADRHRPVFNVTISNVPGPPFHLYSAGARLVAFYPIGPIVDGGGLNITVMSYMGSLGFGLNACRELMPDVWDVADAIPQALEELVKAAQSAAN